MGLLETLFSQRHSHQFRQVQVLQGHYRFCRIDNYITRHFTIQANPVRSKRLSTTKAEGLQEGTWVLLDFNYVVVHIFYSESRKFYDIEGLWHDAPRITLDD